MKGNCKKHGTQNFIVVHEGRAYCPVCAEEMNERLLADELARQAIPPQKHENVSMGTTFHIEEPPEGELKKFNLPIRSRVESESVADIAFANLEGVKKLGIETGRTSNEHPNESNKPKKEDP